MIVSSFLSPPWLARPGHLHPFVRRLTKGLPTYIDHLIRCAQQCGYSVILLYSLLTNSQLPHSRRSMGRYMHGIPPNGPSLCPEYEQSLSLDSAFTPRRFSVVRIHPQLVVATGCGIVAHTDVPHR